MSRSEYNREYRKRKLLEDPDYYKRSEKTRRDKNKDHHNARKAIRRFDLSIPSSTPEYKLWSSARYRCSKSGREFNIEVSDVVIPDTCPVLGTPLSKLPVTDPNYNRDNSPSLDRVDNNLGYIKGNIAVISYRANTLKSFASREELECLVRYLDKVLID